MVLYLRPLGATGASEAMSDELSRGLSIAALVVAALALLVSVLALWRTHFAKMKLMTAAGDVSLHIAHMKGDDDGEEAEWFIPAVDVKVAFTNVGARVGRVKALRMRVGYPELPIPDAHEFFSLTAEVDTVLYEEHVANRFNWLSNAVIGEGAPFVALAKAPVEKHLVFGTRWDDPVIQMLRISLEYVADGSNEWVQVEKWDLDLTPDMWVYLVEHPGGSLSSWPVDHPQYRQGYESKPADLHKYTGSKAPLPTRSKYATASKVIEYRDRAPDHVTEVVKRQEPEASPDGS